MAEKKTKNAQVVISTGRRKKSIARVRLMAGTGKFTVNGRDMAEYLQTDILNIVARQPLTLTNTADKYDIVARVNGGGIAGQAGALCHGIARALVKADEMLKPEIKKAGLLTTGNEQRNKHNRLKGFKRRYSSLSG